MEDSYGERSDEVDITQGESDYGNIPTRKRHFHLEGTKEKEAREKRTAEQRVNDIEKAVKTFRIASSGDGELRGGFGRLPPNPAADLLDRMKDLTKAMNQFNLTGDNLNVSGSFNKGYTVGKENPCEQQQVNQGPT